MGNVFRARSARVDTWALAGRLVLASGLALAFALAHAAGARAEWKAYMAADLGFSVADVDGSGTIETPALIEFTLGGGDNDVSPLLGGSLGLEIPFSELTPWTTPRWLEGFALREEVEVIGLRNYKVTTDSPELGGVPVVNLGKVQTEIDAWSVMVNTWFDIPLDSLYRPISWTSARLFGRWRLRTLKQILDRTTLIGGAGIGAAFLDVETNQDGTRGDEKKESFAWQAGGGLGFRLNDRMNLSLGYRYIDPGSVKVNLSGDGASTSGGSFKIDPAIHEARATLRVELYGFTSPWHYVSR